jgi:formyltetrahydrofolate hydrolase
LEAGSNQVLLSTLAKGIQTAMNSTNNENENQFVLKATCEADSDIIAGLTAFLSQSGCSISDLSQFSDRHSGRLFLRALCQVETGGCQFQALKQEFPSVAEKYDAIWVMYPGANVVAEMRS